MPASSLIARRARPLLGTLVEIKASGKRASVAIEQAFAAVARVHTLMSAQKPASDVASLRAGTARVLHPWTAALLRRAAEIKERTDGLFDCAAGGFSLDGIAKGFAVDCAVEALEAAGMTWGVVNAGGDLRVFGDAFHDVHVRHPRSPTLLMRLGEVRDAAVATSAPYFGASTVIDPRTGARVLVQRSATVIAADCMTADALTKPCLLEPARSRELAARFGALAIMLP